jgi:amino acid adenylation domain-containing protein
MNHEPTTVETGLEVAVTGMSCRFPGAANIDEFWENLKNGVESISYLTDEELTASGAAREALEHPGFVRCAGAVLDRVEYFDAAFFGYTPIEAEQMLPQTRLFHECLWEAMEDAGYYPAAVNGAVGLYAGASSGFNWETLAGIAPGERRLNAFMAYFLQGRDFMGSLISYRLDLGGPSFTLHTACSTSLVAVHLACQGLLSGDCDMALAGGVSVRLQEKNGYVYEEGMISSPDGHCRTFDAGAMGTVGGDGLGVVVLKRLEDAIEDRDNIYAVIRGSAVNNDGRRKVGYTAPGAEGQTLVIRKAMQMAEVDAEEITCVETHGTATPLGDVTEVDALREAFDTGKKQFCALGSVKTNIGHLDTAAGVAGFIKTVLALKHRRIPPSLHFQTPNTAIDFDNSPFYVNTKLRDWRPDDQDKPLLAGVSSFGIGGTNAHVVLAEWRPGEGEAMDETSHRPFQLLLLSAKTPGALDQMTLNLHDYLKANPGLELADAAYTLQVGRQPFVYRRKVVCPGIPEALEALADPASRKVQSYHLAENRESPHIMFVFPGLGSQYVDMGKALYRSEPVFREVMDRCFEILRPLLDYDIKEVLYPVEPSATGHKSIHQADVSQLAVFAVEYALAELLISWGIRPRAMIGYSFGEYAAACVSGVFSLEDALKLLVRRGQLLEQAPGGAMLSVPLPIEEVKPLLAEEHPVGLAIDNGSSCVVSGGEEAVSAFEERMKAKKVLCMRLDARYAIHSTMMEPVLESFRQAAASITLKEPRIPYISTVTGRWIQPADAMSADYWARQMRHTVHFSNGIRLLAEEGRGLFLEIGPGREVSALVKRELEEDFHAVPMMGNDNDARYLPDRLGQLWCRGALVDWEAYYGHERKQRQRISLPTYPFEQQRYWRMVDDLKAGKSAGKGRGLMEHIGAGEAPSWYYIPTWKQKRLLKSPAPTEPEVWLVFTDGVGVGDALAEHLKADNRWVSRLITVSPASAPGLEQLENEKYRSDPSRGADYEELFQELDKRSIVPRRVIHCWGITPGAENDDEIVTEAFSRECLKLGFYSLLYLARAWGRRGGKASNVEFNVIAGNMSGITGGEPLHPAKAAVLGPCLVIPQEYPGIACRAIDIDAVSWTQGRDNGLTAGLIDELTAAKDERKSLTAYRGGRRWIREIDPIHLEESNETHPALLRQNGVYLVTGGLGEIGYMIAQYLVQTVGARLVLTGRSEVPDKDKWGQLLFMGDEDDPEIRNIEKLKQLEEDGGEVIYCSADVADSRQMQLAVNEAETQFGALHGVVHAAGIITGDSFNLIENITDSDCQVQFRSKLHGLLALDKLLKDKAPDFVLLISSIASILGGLGDVAYTAANLFMDYFSLLHSREPAGSGRWISVNWTGAFPEDAVTAIGRILSTPRLENVIFLPEKISDKPSAQSMKAKAARTTGDKGPVEDASLYSRPELSNPYMAPRNALEQQLTEIWQNFFGIEKIGVSDDLFDLGGDSLKAINIISIIHKELNVTVPIKEFFDNSTIEAVAQYISGAESETFEAIEAVESREYYPVSSVQKRLYLLNQVDETSLAYNSPLPVVLNGKIDQDNLAGIFRALIRRHEVLRTSFEIKGEEIVQVVHSEQDIHFDIERFEAAAEGPEVDVIVNGFIRPFDMSKPPFFRVGSVKLPGDRFILLMDTHHVITDGVSHEIFVQEFMTLYQGGSLEPHILQYKDYVSWRLRPNQQTQMAVQERFWLEMFKLEPGEELPVLNLPADYARPQYQSFEGNTVSFIVESDRAGALKSLAASEGATLFMVLLAVYNVFLLKVTGQEDLVVGSGVAGRRHPDLQNMLGALINTLALRAFPGKEKTFRQFLQEIKESTLKAYEHQEYPFEDLVEKVGVKRDTSRNPLFDALFQLQNVPSQAAAPGESQSPSPVIGGFNIDRRIAKFDLTLFCEEVRDGLVCIFEYCTRLFEPQTIDAFITSIRQVIAEVTADPDQTLARVNRLPDARRQDILDRLNNALPEESSRLIEELPAPTLQDMLTGSFSRFEEHIALECGPRKMTYGELDQWSSAIAGKLRRDGIGPFTLTGLLIEDRVSMIAAIIAILKTGGVFVPLDPGLPPARLETVKAVANLSRVLTEKDIGINLTTTLSPGGFNSIGPVHTDGPLYVYFTSGSTGAPRAMLGRNLGLMHFLHWQIQTLGIDAHTRVSQLTAPTFDAYLRDVFVPLCAGGTICIPPREEVLKDGGQLVKWLDRSGIGVVHCVPGVFRSMTSAEEFNNDCFKNLKYILLSGESLHPSDLKSWYKVMDDRVQLLNLWGTSETTLAKTAYWVRPGDVNRERVPVGKPLPGAEVVVLNDNRELRGPWETGELYIKTAFRTYGYLDLPELNRQRFMEDPFAGGEPLHRTGDLGRVMPGGFIDVMGRNDRQVKIRGIRVEPEEIESICVSHANVSEAVVLKRETAARNEMLCAYLVLNKPARSLEEHLKTAMEEGIKRYLDERLPAYMAPSHLIYMDSFPRRPSGKVDYDGLPDPLKELEKVGASGVQRLPADEVEKKLLEFWSDILGLPGESIAMDVSFFQLGGHSLNLMTLITRVHRHFDVRMALGQVFNNPTIEKQAAIIRELKGKVEPGTGPGAYAAIEPVEQKEYYDTTYAQRRVWVLSQIKEASVAFNMPYAFVLSGSFDLTAFEKTFAAVVERHESLRTVFILVGDSLKQKILPFDRCGFHLERIDLTDGDPEESKQRSRGLMGEFANGLFDLEKGPLLRAMLIKIDREDYFFLINLHHIVGDQVSNDVLTSEIIRLYDAYAGGHAGNPLEPLAVQYKDYAAWQDSQLSGEYLERHRGYWLDRFKEAPPRLELPLDRPRPEVNRYRGDIVTAVIENPLSANLSSLADRHGATLFMVLAAGFNGLLFRYTGQTDIVIGTPAAGRDHADLENQVGFYLNTLALRTAFPKQTTFAQLLDRVKDTTVGAFNHQVYPFDKLVETLGINREAARHPLFDVVVDMATMAAPVTQTAAHRLHLQPIETGYKSCKFDLTLYISQLEQGLHLGFEYNTDLFEKTTVQRMADRFLVLLEQACQHPGTPVSDIRLEGIGKVEMPAFGPGARQRYLDRS